ncbi:hypothetical protein BCR42DRAFT_485363 [Absidia repens]|uniref:HCP-like protein n=1 Tax=Absidia repens TaxID=90262 RepID=A0A1X2J010_9FUNG|nr:hypothetical protein BCR42DRAFT_485363 [Absidia repens]
MSMYSPSINPSISIDNAPLPTPTSTRTNTIFPSTTEDSTDIPSSDDSEDEADQVVYRFRVANPDTPSNSKQVDSKSSTPSIANSKTSTRPLHTTSSPSSGAEVTQAEQCPININTNTHQALPKVASPVLDHGNKALPDIPSESSAHLKRRQSKTLGSEEPAAAATTKSTHRESRQSLTRVYAISEIVEYQPHHLRASVLEPLSTTINNPQQEPTPDLSIKLEPPKLIIPPAPSHPPPLPPAKDKVRSSIMTIPPSNDNNMTAEGTQMTEPHLDQQQQQQQHTPPSSSNTNHSKSSENASQQNHPIADTTTGPSSSPSVAKKKPGSNATHRVSKYHHASYSLTNNPDAIKLYREMAEKTQDDMTQLTYAKYLLEVAELYQPMMTMTAASSTNENDAATRDTELHKKKKALEQEGIRWIRRLSKKGVGEAAFLEATWMETEQHGYKTRNTQRIERLYHIAIQAGVPEASYRLALRKESSPSNTQHPYDIFRLYQKAADLHCVAAIYKMAKIYLHGQLEQEQDFKKGMNYLLSAVHHASNTCNEPPYALALILTNKYTKVSIPSDLIESYGGVIKAREYMEKSASLGNIGAKNRLGHLYEHGLYGGSMDMAKAFVQYEEAAKQGHHLQSMLGLSRLYNTGCHGPNDQDEHYRLKNDISGWLATHPKDEDQSFYWCQRAAKGGLPDALYLLGWYYEIGFGTPRNDSLSVDCYQQAYRKGQLDARDRLATRKG